MDAILNSKQGIIFIQPDGPNTELFPLACHDLPDLPDPRGDVTPRYCPDPRNPGGWRLSNRNQGPPDRPTFTITTYVGATADWLERNAACPMPLYVNQAMCGRLDAFLNFDKSRILPYGVVTSHSETNLVMREGNESSEQSFDISSDWMSRAYKLRQTRRTSAWAAQANDIMFTNVGRCIGSCGSAQPICDEGLIVYNAAAPAVAVVEFTLNGGVTWASVNGPWVNTCNHMSCTAFPWSPGVTRWIITRSTLAATNLAIAYSDDLGVTWNVVAMPGALVTEAALTGGALFSLDAQHIWLCTDGAGATGNIYFSDDGGLVWTDQNAPSTDDLNYVRFIDKDVGMCVGNTDEVLLTTDGGVNWALAPTAGAVSGAHILCCDLHDQYRLFIGYSDGTLYFSRDGGTVWTQRVFTMPAGGATAEQITDIMFVNEFCGFFTLIWDDNAAAERTSIYRTINGGTDWEYYTEAHLMTTTGWRALWACDCNHAVAVGDVDVTMAVASIVDVQP